MTQAQENSGIFCDALATLLDYAQADAYPTLTEAECLRILSRHKRWEVWAGSIPADGETPAAPVPAVYGERVVPTVPNGRYYVCVEAGIRGETEPDWKRIRRGEALTDGTATWLDAGPSPPEWDLPAAAQEAWMTKARKVAGNYNIAESGQKMDRAAVYAHCITMAGSFLEGVIG